MFIFFTMKKFSKIMLSAGGALLIGTGAMTSYIKAQQPKTAQEELTLANLEAMALMNSALDVDGGGQSYVICYSESRVKKGYTYYDCGKCPEKIYDEQGKGRYSKCFF
ncbi:Uncharacterised protein [Rikenella microfusus]|uniref:Uncharacterized protein n=2 Tax=Rikenella microfusus TaxID=28139 RepID=A0A379MV01_9BACT|nr:Uncharacterised protein [Rikenella microfusus]